MGLFSKKPPCAICGGKVEFFLPMKVEGEYVCGDCAEKIDMSDDCKRVLTIAGVKEYLAFYEQNRSLAAQFTTTAQVGLSPHGRESVFDSEHRLFCFDAELKKLIFEGSCVKHFTIKEDHKVIFEGTPQGLNCIPSDTISRVEALAPQVALVQIKKSIDREERLKAQLDDDPGNDNSVPPSYHTYIDFRKPFRDFCVDIEVEHPYYSVISFTESGPHISDSDPDINSYISDYEESYEKMRMLAEALMSVAFPGTGSVGAMGNAAAQMPYAGQEASAGQTAPADAIGQIKQYKKLLDAGIISQEEFDTKKRQLMGI